MAHSGLEPTKISERMLESTIYAFYAFVQVSYALLCFFMIFYAFVMVSKWKLVFITKPLRKQNIIKNDTGNHNKLCNIIKKHKLLTPASSRRRSRSECWSQPFMLLCFCASFLCCLNCFLYFLCFRNGYVMKTQLSLRNH